MIVLDSLIKSVNYPLTEDNVEPICIRRGIDPQAELTFEIGNSREYKLSYADILRFVVTMVNLSQGGSISMPNASVLAGTANAIYSEFDEPLIGSIVDSMPIVRVVED